MRDRNYELRCKRKGMSDEEIKQDIDKLRKERQKRYMDSDSPGAVRSRERDRTDKRISKEEKRRRSEERAKVRDRRKADDRKYNGEYRLRQRCKQFGISVSEFWGMWYAQGGRCAICGVDLEIRRSHDKSSRKLSVIDHDHSSGNVRCILCSPCNLYIGMVGVSPRDMVHMSVPDHTLVPSIRNIIPGQIDQSR